jgi:hypothetical protein
MASLLCFAFPFQVPSSIMESFAPCLGVNGAVFIAISTYTTEDNYLTILFKNEDEDSKKLFSKKIVELWCADCKTAGIPVETCNKLGHTADLMVHSLISPHLPLV